MTKADWANTVLIIFSGVGIALAAGLIVACIWGLTRPQGPRGNVRLTRLQRIVQWLGRHKAVTRVL